MKIISLFFVIFHGSFSYNTYPGRYVRDQSSRETCPSQCQCMDLNQRSARGLFDSWDIDRSWQNSEGNVGDNSGRSVVCQGLKELPIQLPADITKLTVYGDSSSMRSRGSRHTDTLISDTQIQYINRNAFRNSGSIKEIIMSGNNIPIMYPSVFHYLRNLEVLSLTNNNIRHLSAAVFNGLGHLQELRLSDNMIKFLPNTVFTYLTELKSLYLNGNKLKQIPRDVLKPLVHLQILDLSRNNISDFYDEMFDHNVDLQELLLNGNRLWKIRPRWFRNLYALRTLSLRGNAIVSVPKESFVNLFNLEELLLSANLIHEIEIGAFQNLRDLKNIDLSTNDLTEIQSFHLSELDSLSELFLSNNKLVKIQNGTFDLVKYLKRLDLSRNHINDIETGSFKGLRLLQNLDLSNNKMLAFRKGVIFGVENLEECRLDNNFIGVIDDGAFMTSNNERLSKLANLNLEQNNIRKIEAETFKGVPRLKILKLGNNDIRKIHHQAMSNFLYLETLTLNNNKLKELNNGLFVNLKKVNSIDLSRNVIRSITEDMFLGLDQLEDLRMSGNKLNSIHKLAFRALPNLSSLDLKENRLVSFNFSMVTNMPQLTTIDLSKNHLFWADIPSTAYLRLKELIISDNNLQSLSSNIENIMGRSSLIFLENNPWKCDCKLHWVVEPSKNVRLDLTSEVMCKSPPELHAKKFTELTVGEMTCGEKNKTMVNDNSLQCNDDVFSKRPITEIKSIGKEIMKKHATVFRDRGDHVTDGVMLSKDWVLVPAGALKYMPIDDLNVRIGRAKTGFKISSVVEHPLLSLGIQKFNVALLKLAIRKRTADLTNQCIISERQYQTISKILPTFSVSVRLDGKKPRTKLKIRKGKLNHKCANDKDYICGIIKGDKNIDMSINGVPLYIGHSSNLRLAGIGIQSWSNQQGQYYFIPLWTISEWVDDVIAEYNKKCSLTKDGKFVCKDLNLPLATTLYMKMEKTEQH